MKVIIKAVQAPEIITTKAGKELKKYNIAYHPPQADQFSVVGFTFSSTIAAEAEKYIGKEVEIQVETGEYSGQPTYKITQVGDTKHSEFKKGGGYQKDVISIERQKSADIAMQLLGYRDQTKIKDVVKEWKMIVDPVYEWISSRPPTPSTDPLPDQKEPLPDFNG